jgi:hypothetical protein
VTSLGDAGTQDSQLQDVGDARDVDAGSVPIAFVQANTIKPTAATTMLALATNVGAHDAIVVCLNYPTASGATLSAISDTLGNTYSVVVGPIDAAGDIHYVAVAADSMAGGDTVTVTLSAAPVNGSDLLVMEYSGLALANAFDVSAQASGNGTALSSGPATTTAAHELVLGYAEAPSASPGIGFTQRALLSGNLTEDKVVSTAGTYDATATTTTGAWVMVLATFKGR